MNRYAKNIILVMSGGTGSRFGADCPKQYCLMDGRMIIDYVMDACRKSRDVDEIVIVASEQYVDFCQERYGVPTVQGGTSRPDSVANGIQFVHDNYDCEKLIITNAVCPLATSEQYDKYFSLIGKNDFVLTTCKSDETLLAAMENASIKAPSLCRVGTCGYCKSILLEGKLKQIGANLTHAEENNDYIHPCVCYPESNIVLRLDI